MSDQKQTDEMMKDITKYDGNVEFLTEEIKEVIDEHEELGSWFWNTIFKWFWLR